jgi:hypothetical protein
MDDLDEKCVWLMAEYDDDELEETLARWGDSGRRARGGSGGDRDDSWDEDGPDEADLAPDDLAPIRCSNCKKWILEDSPQCPYCKHWQVEDEQNSKAKWFIVTAIVCILLIGGYWLFGVFDILSRLRR